MDVTTGGPHQTAQQTALYCIKIPNDLILAVCTEGGEGRTYSDNAHRRVLYGISDGRKQGALVPR